MTELKLYNTLTRKKETFTPIDPSNVRMYVCGPTVYDFAHIGNARPAIVFDVLFRLLRHLYPGNGGAPDGSRVTYVRNITDVDDKINARALRDYGERIAAGEMSLNDAIRQVTESTAKQYHEDVAALGCLEPTVEPRATEHIGGMVKMIQQLLDGGNAYLATGGEGAEVLFSVDSMPDYGALSRRKPEDQQAGARVAVEDHKKNPADFVLWKESAADQPGWEGTFTTDGKTVTIHGRPGWHIECSVMSEAHLGKTFDIHGGGLDLIFPHHENEIAQSRCAHDGAVMSNYWMHNGFVQVEGKKMAKSEGNFVTINDLLHTDKFGGRKWPGEVLRLAMLMTHYREPIDFSERRLKEAENILLKWSRTLRD
ncbi:MAG: cysteine--tRNA ligase, partial [Salaquimonas sp.]|nr:cysteine--tRNA ligase [Salaquimonas sp.]